MTRIAALTGLKREANLLAATFRRAGHHINVEAAGVARGSAQRAADRLAAGRPDLIVSFGLAAGLNPDLAPGHLVIPRTIVAPDGNRYTGEQMPLPELDCVLAHTSRILAGVNAPLLTSADKRALAKETGACIADMETHIAAAAARRTDCRLLVLRAVCDPVQRQIPPIFSTAIRADGGLRWYRIPGMLSHPRALYTLSRESRCAFCTLATAAKVMVRSM